MLRLRRARPDPRRPHRRAGRARSPGRRSGCDRGARGRDRVGLTGVRRAAGPRLRRLRARRAQAGDAPGRRDLSGSPAQRPGSCEPTARASWSSFRGLRASCGGSGRARSNRGRCAWCSRARVHPSGACCASSASASRRSRGSSRAREGTETASRRRSARASSRSTSTCSSRREGRERAARLEDALASKLEPFLFSRDERPVEQIVIDLCVEAGVTLGTAESCTGGLVAALVTALPGSSTAFDGSIVSYANRVKEQALGVSGRLLDGTAPSRPRSPRRWPHGARVGVGVDVAVSVTGSRTGRRDAEKPVGLVYFHAEGAEEVACASRGAADREASAAGGVARAPSRARALSRSRHIRCAARLPSDADARCASSRLRSPARTGGLGMAARDFGGVRGAAVPATTSTSRWRSWGRSQRIAFSTPREAAARAARPRLPSAGIARRERRDALLDDVTAGNGAARDVAGAAGGARRVPARGSPVASARHRGTLGGTSAAAGSTGDGAFVPSELLFTCPSTPRWSAIRRPRVRRVGGEITVDRDQALDTALGQIERSSARAR